MVKVITAPQVFEMHGAEFHSFSRPGTGARDNCVWIAHIPPQTTGKPHAVTRDELFLVLEGSASIRSGGNEFEVTGGQAFVVPSETTFSVSTSAKPFKAVVVVAVGADVKLADGSVISPPWIS
jgi:mannose-6-phosphate isomerase-like protein (cupin superfamily)